MTDLDPAQAHVREVCAMADTLLTPKAKRNLEAMACQPENRERFVQILAMLRVWQGLLGQTQRSINKAVPVLDAALRRTRGKVSA